MKPRRIAVVILFVAAGFALRHFTGWDNAVPAASIAGILIALVVPDAPT